MATLQSTLLHPRTDSELRVAQMDPWFHNIRLPDGTQTAPQHPLGDFPSYKWRQIEPHIPADLSGWRALDIGCNAGFSSLELARRGATIDALDIDPRYLEQADWIFEQHGMRSRINLMQGSVYDLIGGGQYDIVWFMGVLYHLRYPLLALDIVARMVKRLLVFQTLEMPGNDKEKDIYKDLPINERRRMRKRGWPRMAFIEHKLAGDSTNWWAPDGVCTRAMLRSAGLRIVASPAAEIYVCEPNPLRDPCLRDMAEADFRALTRNLRAP